MSKPGRLRRLGLGLAFATIALDQLTKWWIVNFVMNPPNVIEVTPFFNLVLGLNRGVSFGMFSSDSNLSRWLLTALALAIVCALAVWLWRAEKPWLAVALGLIIGGAIGNVIDRVMVGAVVDFLDFHAADYHWPAFNVADMGITCGAAVLIWDSVFGYQRNNFDGEKG
jgi:signal peptidase II